MFWFHLKTSEMVGVGGSYEPLTGNIERGSPAPQASCTQKQEVPTGKPVPTCNATSVSTAHSKSLAQCKQAPTPTSLKELMQSEILKTRKL